MNRRQRLQNLENAEHLRRIARRKKLDAHRCENCGELGGHWVSTRGTSLVGLVTGVDDQEGFWTCPKLYDPVTKRRIGT